MNANERESNSTFLFISVHSRSFAVKSKNPSLFLEI